MAVCDRCGKQLGLGFNAGYSHKSKTYCEKCIEIILHGGGVEKSKEEKEEIPLLTIPELQLQELKQIKEDVHILFYIILIWFIIGIISLILTMIALSG